MDKKNKISENKVLKNKVKELLAKAKKKSLIKSHTLAYKNTLVKEEEHKGQLKAFR